MKHSYSVNGTLNLAIEIKFEAKNANEALTKVEEVFGEMLLDIQNVALNSVYGDRKEATVNDFYITWESVEEE